MSRVKTNNRALKVFQKMVVNGGKTPSLAQAMREAGYSEAYSKNPQKLTSTKMWKDLVKECLPDNDLASQHATLLRASKVKTYTLPEEIVDKALIERSRERGYELIGSKKLTSGEVKLTFAVPDNKTRTKALEIAYKLKGYIA